MLFSWKSLCWRKQTEDRSRGVLLSACQLFTLHHLPQATGLFLPCSLLGSKQIYSEGGKKRERTKGMLQRDGGWERGEGVIPIGTRSQAVYSCYRGVLKPPACFHVCSGLSAQLPPKIIKRKWGYYCTVVDSICDCQNWHRQTSVLTIASFWNPAQTTPPGGNPP